MMYFWLSVALFYLGLSLLGIDLYFDQSFKQYSWVRRIGLIIIVITIILFSHFIVLAQSPLLVRSSIFKGDYPSGTRLYGMLWTPDVKELRITFENPSEDDYQDLDITLRPDRPGFSSTYISAIGQISKLPGVAFMNPEIQLLGADQKGNPLIKFDHSTGNTLGDGVKIIVEGTKSVILPNYSRIRCEKLPQRTNLEISILIENKYIENPKHTISNIWVKGNYRGRIRTHTIDQNISVTNHDLLSHILK